MCLYIGFTGYADRKFNEEAAINILNGIFQDIKKHYGGREIKIVSGGTMCGVIRLLYPMAVQYGYKTVGIICKKGYELELYPVDELYTAGDTWGEESKLFIDMIDILYRIGGGLQALHECQLARQKGIPTVEYELEEIV